MKIFEAHTTHEFLRSALGKPPERGAVKRLGHALRCHPTFISQVLRGKSCLSQDQGLRACRYLGLSENETEFFLALLSHDRAGSRESREYFQSVLKQKLEDRKSFQKRARLKPSLNEVQEARYFQNWIPPYLHALLQTQPPEGGWGLKELVEKTRATEGAIQSAIEVLSDLGLATQKRDGTWTIMDGHSALHLGRLSPLNSQFHSVWRLRSATHLSEGRRTDEALHFTSLFGIDAKAAEEVHELLLLALEKARKRMLDAPSERVTLLSVDFFPL